MEINIPIKMIGDLTQEDLNKKCKAKVDQPLDAYLVVTDGYPYCINVTFNDNYTDFEITTKSTELVWQNPYLSKAIIGLEKIIITIIIRRLTMSM